MRIYIGWDSREDIAYQVCKQSILDNTSEPVEIIPLKQHELRETGDYYRKPDKLASTEFTFTRFLVPHLNKHEGWAMFVDCDFVFDCDVKEIFDQADDQYAIMCVQHQYNPENMTKMDGKEQHIYPRKNWSSMMLFNCAHPANIFVTKDFVNDPVKDGKYLHRFSWLKDREIGKLSHEYNWLVNWYKEPEDGKPKVLHYTEGGPWFKDYKYCDYSGHWFNYLHHYLNKFLDLTTGNKDKISMDKLYQETEDTDTLHTALEALYERSFEARKYLVRRSGEKVAAIVDKSDHREKSFLKFDPHVCSFVQGTGKSQTYWTEQDDGPLIIRGIGNTSTQAIKHCWETGREFYAIDTGYFGNYKKKNWHRITKNNLQHLGPIKDRKGDRLVRQRWRYNSIPQGSNILICPPSTKAMALWNQPDPEIWTQQIIDQLSTLTDRPIQIRLKEERIYRVTQKPMEEALKDNVYCLITYNSIAASEALFLGIPAITLGPNSAQLICNTKLEDIESLKKPARYEVEAYARHLSYCQFSPLEMTNGRAWRILNES